MADNNVTPGGISVLITGGSGFMGSAMVREILSSDSPVPVLKLRIFDLRAYDGPMDPRVEMIIGDVRDSSAVEKACQGMDAVIHSAAVVDWGTRPESEVYDVNFTGTKNVLDACLLAGIRYMVYTSSVDAIYTGKAMVNIDESVPYPEKFPNMYCESKCLAEKLVLQANGDQIVTAALRPSDIYGPGDPYHLGSLFAMSEGGFYVRLGNGSARSQHTYAPNCGRAHLQLLSAMLSGNQRVRGKAYFITDGPPTNFFAFFDAIVAGAGYRIWPKNFRIPRGVAYFMGTMAEFFALLIRPIKKYNPKFSRFAVIYTCSDFTFSAKNAEKDFGYSPKYNEHEAFKTTVDYYKKS